jgi:hypothetical protein
LIDGDFAAAPLPSRAQPGWFARHPGLTMLLMTVALLVPADLVVGTVTNKQSLAAVRHPYYHHGLLPDMDEQVPWGAIVHRRATNSLGMRDAAPRDVALQGTKRRIVFIGDSFTEGVGVNYENTFVGRVAAALAPRGIEVFNAAVQSYSPKLYYLKVKYLIETAGLKFDELEVFVDVSDVQDEVMYEPFAPDGPWSRDYVLRRSSDWISKHSLLGRTVHGMAANRWAQSVTRSFGSDGLQKRALWTIDDSVWKSYGARGMKLAQENMTKLAEYTRARGIKLRLSVYPWPEQIEAQDLDSKQVTLWRDFAARQGVAFTNFFPDFVKPDAAAMIKTYFIQQDAHWNEAGHALIAQRWLQERGFAR